MKQKKSSWMSALFAYAKNAKGELGLSVVLSVVRILLGLVPFFCMYRVICLFAAGTATKAAVISWCAWSLAAYAGKVLCFTLSTGISHHAAYNILEGLRLRLVERFLHAPLGEVQKHSIGEIKSILVDKIENIEPPLAHMIPEGAGHIVLPVVSFIALFAIDWRLALVSLGYFQQVSTGNILNSLTTGLGTLEGMGIRMIDNFVGGYLNFAVVFLSLLVFSLRTAVIALAAAAVSLVFLLAISHYSAQNAPVEAQANRDMTGAILEYARGLAVVKSFGKDAAALDTIRQSIADSKNIHLKIEWGYLPSNALHLLALKCGSVGLALSACLSGLNGQMELPVVLVFMFFSFSIFASLEPISDSAHVLSVIDDAMDQLDKLRENHFIDSDGKDIPLQHFDITFDHVDFGYDSRQVLHDVSFTIPEHTSTAIVGPSGSGKSTLCSLMARFWDVDSGSVKIGGVDARDYTLESLMDQISMVFQNVYLFADTVENNIKFGCPDATHEQVVEAARKACCDDFIEALPDGYNTVIGEGGASLSGGEKQRISIARAMLKDAPIVILDEATANVDPENEHLIQAAISELTRGKTIITIAHRLATIEQADQILVVDDGRIVEQGTHAQLIRQPGRYQQFVHIREKAEGWNL